MPFRTADILSPPLAVRACVCEHYGLKEMPLRVLRKEDEIATFEAEHTEVPAVLWEFVNHDIRIVRMWAKPELSVDLVVWCDEQKKYRMVQDVCFVDAFRDAEEWHKAVYELIKKSKEVWVATHVD